MIKELFRVFCNMRISDTTTFPDSILSPAEVASILLTHRLDSDTALKMVIDRCEEAQEAENVNSI